MKERTLADLAIDHPYYCSDSNWFSREAFMVFDTASEFLDEFENTDIDMNLVFRWDVSENTDADDISDGTYYAKVFMMKQRKGLFHPIHIATIDQGDCLRFCNYLDKHWQRIKDIWMPLSQLESQNAN